MGENEMKRTEVKKRYGFTAAIAAGAMLAAGLLGGSAALESATAAEAKKAAR